MLSYCLKCKKDAKHVDSKVLKLKMVERCYFQNMLYAVAAKGPLLPSFLLEFLQTLAFAPRTF